MNERDMLAMINHALRNFQNGELKDNARSLLNTLGYDSPNRIDFDSNYADFFIENMGSRRQNQQGTRTGR